MGWPKSSALLANVLMESRLARSISLTSNPGALGTMVLQCWIYCVCSLDTVGWFIIEI